MVLVHEPLNSGMFVWPTITGGTLSLSKTQLEALFEGVDWRRTFPPRMSNLVAA